MKTSSNGLCGNSPITVHAFADNELDAKDWIAFKDHLDTCPGCFAAYRQILALKALLKHSLLQYQAPASLRMEIALELQAASKVVPAGVCGAKSSDRVRLSRPNLIGKEWKQITLTGSALAVSLVIAITLIFSMNGPALEDEIIASYRRSLALSLSSNALRATSPEEKSRLIGNLDFVPLIPDLAASGFSYKGARLDQIARRNTAVLIYAKERNVINLFIWPSESEPIGTVSRQGYNIIRWTRAGLKFCAISTLNATELSQFQELFASKLPA
jgi:anti-sigma factor (TIGR02949 family)